MEEFKRGPGRPPKAVLQPNEALAPQSPQDEVAVIDDTPAMMEFLVNLPPHAGNIRIDGREFFHGFTYSVSPAQYAALADAQARAWNHDREVMGQRKPFDSYRLKPSF
jgi:hypothetical protein